MRNYTQECFDRMNEYVKEWRLEESKNFSYLVYKENTTVTMAVGLRNEAFIKSAEFSKDTIEEVVFILKQYGEVTVNTNDKGASFIVKCKE